jgi:hypothetical protein
MVHGTPFVFEEPKASYFLLGFGVRQALLALGPLAPERLVHIEQVHVVYQPDSKTQITVARRLDAPHYQATSVQIQASSFSPIIFYQDSFPIPQPLSDFLYVCSDHSGCVEGLLSQIDFDVLGRRLLSRKPMHSVRQSYFEDFGICSGQCTSRKGSELGISKPSTKPGSNDKVINEVLVTCSNIIRALGMTIFDYGKERLLSFAGTLADGNLIEAMRLAITDESNLCGIHEDQNNDPAFPSVPVFSKFIWVDEKRFRVSIIMYSRQSISDYLKRKNKTYGPAVTFVMDSFAEIPEERRSIIPGSFRARNARGMNCHGLMCYNLPCHMDPSFFISPVIHFGIMLSVTHSLDFAELVSIFRAWAAMPYTSYYFCSAVILLLQERRLPCRGLLLGRFLLLMMKDERVKHQTSKPVTKIPGYRFATYRQVVVPTSDQWNKSTKEVVRLCLESSFRQEPPGDKKDRAAFYEKTRKAIASEIPNAGSLITNHLMGVFSSVGLVPLWFGEEHSVETSSLSIKFYTAEKGLAKGKPAAQRFLDSLSGALQSRHGIPATRKYAENVGCKIFRITGTDGSDTLFADLYFQNQCVFQFGIGQIIIHRQGFQSSVVRGPLIDRWAFGGSFCSLPQLLLQIGSVTKEDFQIPKGLGNQGGNTHTPTWMINIFPRPFVVPSWCPKQDIVARVVKKM